MQEPKKRSWFSRLLVDIKPLFLSETITELIGNRRLSIQGLQDILQFTPQEIRLKTRSGIIRICGEDLAVTILTQDSIELKGSVTMLILTNEKSEG